MNEETWLGITLRAVISLGVLLMGAGFAARVCRGTVAWAVAALLYGAAFAWVNLTVVPRPNEAGLVYAIQWGAAGAALYCAARALGLINRTAAGQSDSQKEA